MKIVEKLLYISVFTILGLFSIWVQYLVMEKEQVVFDGDARHDPDYYIENFTAVGMDEQGKRRYILEAERMVHYPDDDTALLDNPHIVQFEPGLAPRHTYSESGWVSSDGNEVLLTGDVRVIQGKGAKQSGGVMRSEKMRILLKDKKKESG